MDLQSLQKLLPESCSVSTSLQDVAPRWSDYGAPKPRFVVTVTKEEDIAHVVRACTEKGIPFLVSNGANGAGNQFDLGQQGVVINIAPLDKVTIHPDGQSATIQAGVTSKQLVEAGYHSNLRVRFAVSTCNTLGWLGAALSGGLCKTLGHDGHLIDQIISANVVLANGETVSVSEDTNPDLFWAIKGAGPNFGVVVSARIKAWPIMYAQGSVDIAHAWMGVLAFPGAKLEELIQAADEWNQGPHMGELDIQIFSMGAPDLTITVHTFLALYDGRTMSQKDVEQVFDPFMRVGPSDATWNLVPQDHWNDICDPVCARGPRKPGWTATQDRFDPKTFRQIYTDCASFAKEHIGKELGLLYLQMQIFPQDRSRAQKLLSKQQKGSWAWREVKCHTICLLAYGDPAFDKTAEGFGEGIRALLRSLAGVPRNGAYANFAHGDEDLETIFGSSLPKLKELKLQYDPNNAFDQWFPLLPRRTQG